MAVPIYDDDDIDEGNGAAPGAKSPVSGKKPPEAAGELSPITAQFVQYYIETHQHQIDEQQLAALKAWRTKYLKKQSLLTQML